MSASNATDWRPGDALYDSADFPYWQTSQPIFQMKDDLDLCAKGSCALCYPDNPWPALRSDHMTVTFEKETKAA